MAPDVEMKLCFPKKSPNINNENTTKYTQHSNQYTNNNLEYEMNYDIGGDPIENMANQNYNYQQQQQHQQQSAYPYDNNNYSYQQPALPPPPNLNPKRTLSKIIPG